MLLCEHLYSAGIDPNDNYYHSNKGIHYSEMELLTLLVNKGEIWDLALCGVCRKTGGDFCSALRQTRKKCENIIDTSWPVITNMPYQYWRYIIMEIMTLANIKFQTIAKTFGESFVCDRTSDIIDLKQWQPAPMRGLMCQIYFIQQYNVCMFLHLKCIVHFWYFFCCCCFFSFDMQEQLKLQLDLCIKYLHFLKYGVGCSDFYTNVSKFTGVVDCAYNLQYKVLADLEAYDNVDGTLMLKAMDVIIQLLNDFTAAMAIFYTYTNNKAGVKKSDTDQKDVNKEKRKFEKNVMHLIESIIHWSVYSSASIKFAEYVHRAIPDQVNDIWYFASDHERQYGLLWGDEINSQTGYFDSKASMFFYSKHMYVAGVQKKPQILNQQWLYYLSTIIWMRTMMMDATISMNKTLEKYIHYSKRWCDLWSLVRDQLDASTNAVSTWRQRIANAAKEQEEMTKKTK